MPHQYYYCPKKPNRFKQIFEENKKERARGDCTLDGSRAAERVEVGASPRAKAGVAVRGGVRVLAEAAALGPTRRVVARDGGAEAGGRGGGRRWIRPGVLVHEVVVVEVEVDHLHVGVRHRRHRCRRRAAGLDRVGGEEGAETRPTTATGLGLLGGSRIAIRESPSRVDMEFFRGTPEVLFLLY